MEPRIPSDPLAPLRRLPEAVRGYYYRIVAALGATVLAVTAVVGGDVAAVGQLVTAFLGLTAAVLATANTTSARRPTPPRDQGGV